MPWGARGSKIDMRTPEQRAAEIRHVPMYVVELPIPLSTYYNTICYTFNRSEADALAALHQGGRVREIGKPY